MLARLWASNVFPETAINASVLYTVMFSILLLLILLIHVLQHLLGKSYLVTTFLLLAVKTFQNPQYKWRHTTSDFVQLRIQELYINIW